MYILFILNGVLIMIKMLLILIVAFSTVSCSTSVDPREGGFFAGVSAIQSGAYKKDIIKREKQVNSLSNYSKSLDAESMRLDAELARLNNLEKSEKQRLKSIDAQIQRVTNKVRSLSRNQNNKKLTISMQKRNLAIINSQISNLSQQLKQSKSNDVRLRKNLNKKLDSLMKEYRLLSSL